MKRKQNEEELSLESWKKECAEMQSESDREDAELRKQMEEIEANAEMDPEVKQAMLEVGERSSAWESGLRISTPVRRI